MGNWFGDLDLAYKYTVVFVSLLVLTLIAGFVKVMIDRRRMKKLTAQQNEEAGQREEQVELTHHREKDEGDLFGIRAIEAGFYAGIPQSRPTSRAGSVVDSPAMSSSTLVGGFNSPKIQTHSMASSVTTLPLAHTNDRNRDSDTLPSHSPPRRKSPPAFKLRPSEAELSGRINHNAAVNMNLDMPPSPVHDRHTQSPTFGGSDSGESDGRLSPRSPGFKPEHYAPSPPQIPMPEGLRASVVSIGDLRKSQAASFTDASTSNSPNISAPTSPGHPPEARLPSMPERALTDGQRSLFPGYHEPESRAVQSNIKSPPDFLQDTVTERPASPERLLPNTYQPSHQRNMSKASSVYSDKRTSTVFHQHTRTSSNGSHFNYSFPENSNRNSLARTISKEQSRRPSQSSSLLAPGSSNSNQTSDPRFSEFYDAYYRRSQVNPSEKADGMKRANQLHMTQPTIVEVPSPLPSPMPPTKGSKPGVAM